MQSKIDRPIKIGAAAQRLGVNEATLRFYENEGLVTPLRTAGGTRLYDHHHLNRLSAVIRLTEAGVPIEAIRRLAQARKDCTTGDASSRLVSKILMERLTEIRRKRLELEKLEDGLQKALELVSQCRGCTNRPDSQGCPNCPVNLNLGEPKLLDLIWE